MKIQARDNTLIYPLMPLMAIFKFIRIANEICIYKYKLDAMSFNTEK